MNALILEDEPLVAQKIMGHIKILRPGWALHGPIPSVRETKEWLQSNPAPGLIIADIQLSDGISIDLLASLKYTSPVIFITAFDQYAIRAFKINSIDYILKPVDLNDLEEAFEKFERQNQVQLANLSALFEYMSKSQNKRAYKENFLLTHGQNSQLITQNEIAYFLKEDLVFLVHTNLRRYVVDFRSLDEIEEIVDPEKYFRTNRQFLVQRKSIIGFKSNTNGTLTLSLKFDHHPPISVSRERGTAFKKWFEESP
jgi:two-component system, LytTR family, response regulator